MDGVTFLTLRYVDVVLKKIVLFLEGVPKKGGLVFWAHVELINGLK